MKETKGRLNSARVKRIDEQTKIEMGTEKPERELKKERKILIRN